MANFKNKTKDILFNLLLWLLFVGLSFYGLEKNFLINSWLDFVLQIALILLAGLILVPTVYETNKWLIKAKKIAIGAFVIVGIVCFYYALWWRGLIYLFLTLYWPKNKVTNP